MDKRHVIIEDFDFEIVDDLASAYATLGQGLEHGTLAGTNDLWHVIWQLNVPQMVHVFLWLVVHGRLLTNVESCHCHISASSSCTKCSCNVEVLNQCDNVTVIRIFSGESLVLTDNALVARIKGLLARKWDVKIPHVQQEANMVADKLASMAR
ncbi:hypothetical protein GQ457_02G022360 [Hibiscus cannabinus]